MAVIGAGTILDGTWRIERVLGRGGNASVYQVVHVRTGLRAAAKLLDRSMADPNGRQRLADEAQIANAIGHPGVVRVIGDGVHAGLPFIVMDLVPGSSLGDRCDARGGKLTLDELAPIVDQVLDVLGAAHAREVIHRDIKPDNVLIEPDGTVRIVDFGIARVRRERQLTQIGSVLGTPPFMAPEHAAGRWEEVDARTDLFSVAAMTFTALTGKLVHPGANVSEMVLHAGRNPVPPVASLDPSIPGELAAVLDRALAFHKERRFGSANEMREALRAAVAAVARRLRPPPGPLRLVLGAAAVGLLVTFGIVSLVVALRENDVPPAKPSARASEPRPRATTPGPVATSPTPPAFRFDSRPACARDFDALKAEYARTIPADARYITVSIDPMLASLLVVRPSAPLVVHVYSHDFGNRTISVVSRSELANATPTFQLSEFDGKMLARACRAATAEHASRTGIQAESTNITLRIGVGETVSHVVVHIGNVPYCFEQGGARRKC